MHQDPLEEWIWHIEKNVPGQQPLGNGVAEVLITFEGPEAQSIADEAHSILRDRANVRTWSLTHNTITERQCEDQTGRSCLLPHQKSSQGHRNAQTSVEELVKYTDLMVVMSLRATTLAKMLHGIVDDFLLELLRSWDTSKPIFIVPGMSRQMWDNPMTTRQLEKIKKKWKWIRILKPILWNSADDVEAAHRKWIGSQELSYTLGEQIESIISRYEADPMIHGTVKDSTAQSTGTLKLPAEIWTLIMDLTGDWELAKALGIYTNLPIPFEWQPSVDERYRSMEELKWALLTGSPNDFVRLLDSFEPPKLLSKLNIKLIVKFARTDILSYLEKHHQSLFWSHFGHTFLPTKASGIFGQVAVLDWWYTSPSFRTKEYNADALDLASKAGFIHVLEWWRGSDLPLRYTDSALEQASLNGRIDVLEWWRKASTGHAHSDQLDDRDTHSQNGDMIVHSSNDNKGDHPRQLSDSVHANTSTPLRLKVGKSLIFAAQNGHVGALKWWMASGIPAAHEEAVARTASASGHVAVLELWKDIKGESMQYDNQVLVGPTKNGHADVLEWWKQSRYRVEYKTCDIEEALEDSVGGKETRIREWWGRNGLNLGVGISEWMKTKVL
ncbi:MAG: hypothetical protein LQ342_007708 [Letrouitia transgressa]|nr:MAG: hypothetical protein LQ342_007708 [Letrouitia transgressa]